jgi:hypothetical protein
LVVDLLAGFGRWWGTAMLLGAIGLYLVGPPWGRAPYNNRQLWGALFFSVGVGWFIAGGGLP